MEFRVYLKITSAICRTSKEVGIGNASCQREAFAVSMRVVREVLTDKMAADLCCKVGDGASHGDSREKSNQTEGTTSAKAESGLAAFKDQQ